MAKTATRRMEYSSTHYSHMKHIDDACKWHIDGNVKGLLKLLADSNNIIGVCRLHKHFEVEAGECVVTKPFNGGFSTEVKSFNDEYLPW